MRQKNSMMTNDSKRFHNNFKLRSLMLTRGWKAPYVRELLGHVYAKGTINKWHGLVKPMPDRAWDLLQLKMREAGLC